MLKASNLYWFCRFSPHSTPGRCGHHLLSTPIIAKHGDFAGDNQITFSINRRLNIEAKGPQMQNIDERIYRPNRTFAPT